MGVRIAWLMPTLKRGGGTRMAVELSHQLVLRGHSVTILVPAGRLGFPVPSQVKVITCGRESKSPLAGIIGSLPSLWRKLPEVDLIIASMFPFTLMGRVQSFVKGIPCLYFVMGDEVALFDDRGHIRGRPLLFAYRRLTIWSYLNAQIIVNSQWTGAQLIKYGAPPPIGVVPGGVSPAFLAPQVKGPTFQNPVKILTIGRKLPAKGLSDLVQAVNLLVANGHKFSLSIISSDVDILPDAHFPYQILKPNSDDELISCYQQGDLFVNPSWREGFALPVLEAMAAGLPVITTDCGGVNEFVKHEVNALVVPVRDAEALAGAILRLRNDPGLSFRLAQEGWRIAHRFSWECSADILDEIIARTLGLSALTHHSPMVCE